MTKIQDGEREADVATLRRLVYETSDDAAGAALERLVVERDAADENLVALAELVELRTSERDAAERALERIAEQQPKTLETLRSHGVVFDGPLGNDPKNWQHVAFSIYTDLCEVDTFARTALADLRERPEGTSQP